jgi:hypothetical protein
MRDSFCSLKSTNERKNSVQPKSKQPNERSTIRPIPSTTLLQREKTLSRKSTTAYKASTSTPKQKTTYTSTISTVTVKSQLRKSFTLLQQVLRLLRQLLQHRQLDQLHLRNTAHPQLKRKQPLSHMATRPTQASWTQKNVSGKWRYMVIFYSLRMK